MPHGESWLTLLFEKYLHGFAAVLGKPFNVEGTTWLAHSPIRFGHVLALLLVMLILVIVGIATRARVSNTEAAIVPGTTRARVSNTEAAIVPGTKLDAAMFAELFTGNVYDTMSSMMGREAAKYFLPLIGTCAFVIFTSNVIGLIPGMTPPTDNLNTTLAMGVVIFLATHIYGLKEHGFSYLKHFLGPVWYLAWLMLPIELISHFSRPLTLGIRLMANMTADHMVLTIFLGFGIGSWFLWPTVFYILGCLVVVVQTMVFCLLSTVYISMAIAHDGH